MGERTGKHLPQPNMGEEEGEGTGLRRGQQGGRELGGERES